MANKVLRIVRNTALVSAAALTSYKIIADRLFEFIFNHDINECSVKEEYLEWFNKNKKLAAIKSYDGIKLNAYLIDNNDNKNFLVLVHGLWNNSNEIIYQAYEFNKLGYNLLIVDLRNTGLSDKDICTYGLKESFDLINWCDHLNKYYKDINIILYGVTMGASTCLMATKNKLPDNIKCIISDGAYSSFKELLKHILKNEFNIVNSNIILKIFESKMYSYYGYKFSDISAKDAIERNNIPTLFIHGKNDNIIPFDMSLILYNHNLGKKKYYPVPDSEFANTCQAENYFKIIDEFITSNI